jgi:copper chaperone CopZ
MTLVVSKMQCATQVGRLEDALERLNGVQKVTRRSFAGGVAEWEMDVLSEMGPQLARDLEETPILRPFHLTVTTENRAKITASATVRTVRSATAPQ